MVSAKSEFKIAKRKIVGDLDLAKVDRESVDSTIRRQAELQYNALLTKLHSQNQAFDELLLDLKTQVSVKHSSGAVSIS